MKFIGLFFLGCMHASLAWPQYQQNPPMYAPQHLKYRVSQDKNEIENVGGRTVKWVSDAKPEQWLVAVAEDADIKKIVFADYTKEAQYTLPQLKEGTYYIKVFGITDKEIVDEKAPKEFIVQRYDQSNTLTAPELMTPPNNQEYEPFPRLRIGWKSVPGARAYRVQIWNQKKINASVKELKLPTAMWVTEVKQPWLEIHDVPYSSYMYLGTADYRWDVAAIDAAGQTGPLSTRSFSVTPQLFMKQESFVRFYLAYSPALKYDTTSATGNLTRAYSVKAYGLGLEYERWVKRHWGFDVRYKPMLYELFPAGVLSAASYSARAAYREHLTEQAYGFAFVAKVYAGLFAQEFRQIDRDVRPIKTSLPTGIGPQIGAEITWKISPKASLDAFASLSTLPFSFGANGHNYTQVSGTETTRLKLGFIRGVRLKYSIFPESMFFLGFQSDTQRLSYVPKQRLNYSGVEMSGANTTFGIQLDY